MTSAIPWEFTGSSASAGTWIWTTHHFRVTLIAAGTPNRRHYQWAIQDLTKGESWTFAEGQHHEFATAADQAVEYALKSYPHHGYSRYAPHLIGTYTLRGGRRENITHLAGLPVDLEVITPTGPTHYSGNLVLGGHDIVLRTHLGEWAFRPESVTRVSAGNRDATSQTGHSSALPSKP